MKKFLTVIFISCLSFCAATACLADAGDLADTPNMVADGTDMVIGGFSKVAQGIMSYVLGDSADDVFGMLKEGFSKVAEGVGAFWRNGLADALDRAADGAEIISDAFSKMAQRLRSKSDGMRQKDAFNVSNAEPAGAAEGKLVEKKSQDEEIEQRRQIMEQTADDILKRGFKGLNSPVMVFATQCLDGSFYRFDMPGMLYSSGGNLRAPEKKFSVSLPRSKNEFLLNLKDVEKKLKSLFDGKLVKTPISSQIAVTQADWARKVSDFEADLKNVAPQSANLAISEEEQNKLKGKIIERLVNQPKDSDSILCFAFLYSPERGARAIRFVYFDGFDVRVIERACEPIAGYRPIKPEHLKNWLNRLTKEPTSGAWVESGMVAITLHSSNEINTIADFVKDLSKELEKVLMK